MATVRVTRNVRVTRRPPDTIGAEAIQLIGGNSVAVATWLRVAGVEFRASTHPSDASLDTLILPTAAGGAVIVRDGDWITIDADQAAVEEQPALHPATAAVLRYFDYAHLPDRLQAVSGPFRDLAYLVVGSLQGPELMVCLRKLLEAKDCAVRAALPGKDS